MLGTYFRVQEQHCAIDGLNMIQLYEMRRPYKFFLLPNSKSWRQHGIRQLVSYQASIKCSKDWSQTNDYSIFKDNIHHKTVT